MKGFSATTRASGGHCPYAEALQQQQQDEEQNAAADPQNNNHDNDDTSPSSLPITNCPAFSNGSCPFKDAHSADQVRQTLLQVPASHLKGHQFYQVLQNLHKIHPSSDNYQLPGGCPVQSSGVLQELQTPTTQMRRPIASFTEALEGVSLSAIMARMAADMEKQQNNHEDDGYESSSSFHKEENDRKKETQEEEPVLQTEPSTDHKTPASPSGGRRRSSLSESLKTGTAVSHQDAEDVHFVKNFIVGKIDRGLYATLVLDLYHVYQKLEHVQRQFAGSKFPSMQHFVPPLERTAALAQDVDFWHGLDVDTDKLPPMSPATADYVARLQHVADTDSLLLLAHSYTRYLGDLSGGKILARVARRALQLGDRDAAGRVEGLAFYDFPSIQSAKRFKDEYRSALDALPLTSLEIKKLVAEANVAFCLNIRLFQELDVQANVPGAVVKPLSEALEYAAVTFHDNSNDTDKADDRDDKECPFLVQQQQGNHDGQQQQHHANGKRCPWPFILAHDPVQGMMDWQTWLVIGLILCWAWNHWCSVSAVLQEEQA